MKTLIIKIDSDENGQYPLCPYCHMELKTIKDYRNHFKFLSNIHIFTCPQCNKVLNINTVSK